MLRTVAVIAMDEVAAFELGVLAEVFGTDRTADGFPSYRFDVCTADGSPARSRSGFLLTPTADLGPVGDADLVVNATSVGMRTSDGSQDWATALPCDAGRLSNGQVVAELVYHPLRTALMDAAAQRGARTSNGLSMLIHQAAAAFERWTGHEAPVQAMRTAVQDRLDDPSAPVASKS